MVNFFNNLYYLYVLNLLLMNDLVFCYDFIVRVSMDINGIITYYFILL